MGTGLGRVCRGDATVRAPPVRSPARRRCALAPAGMSRSPTRLRGHDPQMNQSNDVRPDAGKWTCPMHPRVVREGPGTCPICGMALEPVLPTGEHDNAELRDMQRRFWIAVALSVPVVLLGMSEYVAADT